MKFDANLRWKDGNQARFLVVKTLKSVENWWNGKPERDDHDPSKQQSSTISDLSAFADFRFNEFIAERMVLAKSTRLSIVYELYVLVLCLYYRQWLREWNSRQMCTPWMFIPWGYQKLVGPRVDQNNPMYHKTKETWKVELCCLLGSWLSRSGLSFHEFFQFQSFYRKNAPDSPLSNAPKMSIKLHLVVKWDLKKRVVV